MSSDTPQTDLWLERSRLDGMLLGAVSYGGFLLLTIQAVTTLTQPQPRKGVKIAENRLCLLFYISITFVLATIGFGANARYTEMIWIDLRDAPGGPAGLIEDEMNYSINVLALACYYIMEWFMQALLLHRCFVIWNWARYVMVPMIAIYFAMIAMSIIVLIQANTGAVWYNINTELIYLSLEIGLTVIYTVLVTSRILVMRRKMKQAMRGYDSGIYDAVLLVVVESAMLYSTFAIIFLVSFAVHSDVSNLCFLAISHVQGIAQLIIIIRVARGRDITYEWSMRVIAAPEAIPATRTFPDETNAEAMQVQTCRSTPNTTTDPTYVYKLISSSSPPPTPLPTHLPPSPLDQSSGFIHLSTSLQIPNTLKFFYKTDTSVYILRIPYARVEKHIRWEDPKAEVCGLRVGEGGFPHLYNALKLGSEEVESVQMWEREVGVGVGTGTGMDGWDAALKKAEGWLVY